jgi:uroporphyrinogen-III decarboxylase
MTSRERLVTAMGCGQPDRVPVVVRGICPWDEAWIGARHISYAPVIEAVARHCDWEAAWGASNPYQSAEPMPHETYFEDEPDWRVQVVRLQTPGGELVYRHKISKRGLPAMRTEFPIKAPEHVDWILSLPYRPYYPPLDSLRDLQRRVGERGVVMVTLSSPISLVHDLLGSERLALWSIDCPEVVDRMVEEFRRRIAQTLEYLLDRRAAEVYGMLGEEFLTPPLASPADFERWVVRPESCFGEMIHSAGALFWVHCHGPVRRALPGFLRMGVDCLHPVEAPPMGDIDIGEAKGMVAGRMCLEGDIQIGELYAASEERVRQLVRLAIDRAACGGGFILCPTASPHTEELSPQTVNNYLAYVDEALCYGAM